MFNLSSDSTSTMEPHPAPTVDDVRQVVQDVFAAMLHLEVVDADGDAELDRRSSLEPRLNACVQITGAWQGAIVVEIGPQFARRAAAIVFDVPRDQVSDDDVTDALAELVNMIGGNIKTLLPSPSVLSLPAVTEGRDFLLTLPGARLVHGAAFRCNDHRLRILICEKTATPTERKHAPRREVDASISTSCETN